MAIYHLSARHPIARAAGRSATAAAAYRAGTAIHDVRTGLKFDYSRRHGVLDARIQLPGGRLVADRAAFWNSIEGHHRRRDAVVAREVVVALPAELSPNDRSALAFGFALEIADRFSVAVDCALHEPSQDGDDRNFHAHLLLTACEVGSDGAMGKKVMGLDPIVCKRSGTPDSVSWLRPRWQDVVNATLAQAGLIDRIDHRSYLARGIERHPTVHVGKRGLSVRGRASLNSHLRARNAKAAALEAGIEKLQWMRARLAARSSGGGQSDFSTSEAPLPLSAQAHPAIAGRTIGLQERAFSDSEAELLPWKRRSKQSLPSPDVASSDAMVLASSGSSTAKNAVGSGMRRMQIRVRR